MTRPIMLIDEIAFHGSVGSCACIRSEFATGVDSGVDAGVGAVADDSSEFPPSGIDEIIPDKATVVQAVVAKVGGDGARAKVDLIADDGVTDIGEVADR